MGDEPGPQPNGQMPGLIGSRSGCSLLWTLYIQIYSYVYYAFIASFMGKVKSKSSNTKGRL